MVLPDWMPAPDSVPFHFFSSIVASVLPVYRSEIGLVAAASLIKGGGPVLFVLPAVAAVGHMIGKFLFYVVGRKADGFIERNPKRKALVDEARAKLPASVAAQAAIYFASSFVGFPPLFALALAAGVMRLNLFVFLGSGLVGRYLRYLVCTLVPATAQQFVVSG